MKIQIPVQCPSCSKAFALEGELPDPVVHLVVQWFDGAPTVSRGSPLGAVGVIRPGPPPVLFLNLPAPDQKRITISVPVNPRGSLIGPIEKPVQYGMRHLGPGVYTLEPSVAVNGTVQAFVTIIDVPVPAPWDPK